MLVTLPSVGERFGEPYVTWLADVRYKDFDFTVQLDNGTRYFMQVCWNGIDAVTGEPRRCKGRKWWLSDYMTRSEVIQTALAAVLVIEEHEAREEFKYKGLAVYGPHYDVDQLAELAAKGDAHETR